jgi:transcriptional regulator NrdR family protein
LADQSNKPHVVKRMPGHSEPYDERKLYASIYAACLVMRTPVGEAEITAAKVCKDIQPWLQNKTEVTSTDIRHKAADHLKLYNPDAAYMYVRHRAMV